MDETHRIMECSYCGANNYLFAPGLFRFVLPHEPVDQEMIYAPYLRFKGNVFYCQNETIGYRFVDITRLGFSHKSLPASLGLRPQAMKMKFLSPDIQGTFLKFTLKAKDIVAKAARLSTGSACTDIFHRAFIGETLSVIYLPLFIKADNIYDAILKRPINSVPKTSFSGPGMSGTHDWNISLHPTLCPDCGWDLKGEKDSVVFVCENCCTAWEAFQGSFYRVDAQMVKSTSHEPEYFPFWRLDVAVKGMEINSFGDFVRVTNQPLVHNPSWDNLKMAFYAPAFKIRPKTFLRLARQITVSQIYFKTEKMGLQKGIHPATLARDEAAQSLKMILADAAMNKKTVFPFLPHIRIDCKGVTLVYIPFKDLGYDMVLEDMQIAINKQALGFGRNL